MSEMRVFCLFIMEILPLLQEETEGFLDLMPHGTECNINKYVRVIYIDGRR